MYKADSHIHTSFSFDGRQTPEELIEAAVKAGLDEVTVTEHCECNDNSAIPEGEVPWPDLDVKAYTETYEKLKETSPVKINIGIELGQATQGKEYAARMTGAYKWDFILGSLHNVRNEYDFYYIDYKNKDINRLFKEYFEQLYETVEYGGFSVLTHLYYPVRYIYRAGLTVDITLFDDQIFQILKLAVKKGIGLEINTSALNDKFGDFVPGFRYAKMYRGLGGETVTVGSDSHYPSKVGLGIEKAYDMLREAGYSFVSTFESQRPVYHKL